MLPIANFPLFKDQSDAFKKNIRCILIDQLELHRFIARVYYKSSGNLAARVVFSTEGTEFIGISNRSYQEKRLSLPNRAFKIQICLSEKTELSNQFWTPLSYKLSNEERTSLESKAVHTLNNYPALSAHLFAITATKGLSAILAYLPELLQINHGKFRRFLGQFAKVSDYRELLISFILKENHTLEDWLDHIKEDQTLHAYVIYQRSLAKLNNRERLILTKQLISSPKTALFGLKVFKTIGQIKKGSKDFQLYLKLFQEFFRVKIQERLSWEDFKEEVRNYHLLLRKKGTLLAIVSYVKTDVTPKDKCAAIKYLFGHFDQEHLERNCKKILAETFSELVLNLESMEFLMHKNWEYFFRGDSDQYIPLLIQAVQGVESVDKKFLAFVFAKIYRLPNLKGKRNVILQQILYGDHFPPDFESYVLETVIDQLKSLLLEENIVPALTLMMNWLKSSSCYKYPKELKDIYRQILQKGQKFPQQLLLIQERLLEQILWSDSEKNEFLLLYFQDLKGCDVHEFIEKHRRYFLEQKPIDLLSLFDGQSREEAFYLLLKNPSKKTVPLILELMKKDPLLLLEFPELREAIQLVVDSSKRSTFYRNTLSLLPLLTLPRIEKTLGSFFCFHIFQQLTRQLMPLLEKEKFSKNHLVYLAAAVTLTNFEDGFLCYQEAMMQFTDRITKKNHNPSGDVFVRALHAVTVFRCVTPEILQQIDQNRDEKRSLEVDSMNFLLTEKIRSNVRYELKQFLPIDQNLRHYWRQKAEKAPELIFDTFSSIYLHTMHLYLKAETCENHALQCYKDLVFFPRFSSDQVLISQLDWIKESLKQKEVKELFANGRFAGTRQMIEMYLTAADVKEEVILAPKGFLPLVKYLIRLKLEGSYFTLYRLISASILTKQIKENEIHEAMTLYQNHLMEHLSTCFQMQTCNPLYCYDLLVTAMIEENKKNRRVVSGILDSYFQVLLEITQKYPGKTIEANKDEKRLVTPAYFIFKAANLLQEEEEHYNFTFIEYLDTLINLYLDQVSSKKISAYELFSEGRLKPPYVSKVINVLSRKRVCHRQLAKTLFSFLNRLGEIGREQNKIVKIGIGHMAIHFLASRVLFEKDIWPQTQKFIKSWQKKYSFLFNKKMIDQIKNLKP